MKRYLLCYLFILISGIISNAQYIKLEGKQFVDENGNDFYPMVMNYYVDLAFDPFFTLPPTDLSHTHLAQFIQSGSNGCFNYTNVIDGPTRILQDFYEIKNMGFNTVRLVMQTIKRPGNSGFFFTLYNFQSCAYQDDTINVLIYPPYNLVTNNRLIFFFEKIKAVIEIAATVGLKVWLGCGSPETIHGDDATYDYRDYLISLADFIHENNENENKLQNLFCYEFYGEPSFTEIYDPPEGYPYVFPHSKSKICQIVNVWNDALKEHDPNHLTTIGAIGTEDPKSWDPNLLNVDFTNIHLYLDPKTFEWNDPDDPPGSYWLDHCFKRFKDKIYLYDKKIIKPYIIAETSFPGDNPNDNPFMPYPHATYGNEQDGANFVDETFSLIKNSFASGYGWWDFQNKCWFESLSNPPNGSENLEEYIEDHFGLLRFGEPDPNDLLNGYENSNKHLRKLAGWTFKNYISNPPTEGTPDYGPITSTVPPNDDDPYYNPYNHPDNNTEFYDPNEHYYRYGTIEGYVKDQNGNPIKGAIVKGASLKIGNDPDLLPQPNVTDYYHYTFTDETGYFKLRAYDYLPGTNNWNEIIDGTIVYLLITAYGCNYIELWNNIPKFSNYTLNSLQSVIDAIVKDQNIPPSPLEPFEGYSSILAYNDQILSGGIASFKARNYIDVKSLFYAESGSEVHLFIESVPMDCNEIFTIGLKKTDNILDNTEFDKGNNEIEIDFYNDNSDCKVEVYPNPCKEIFTIEITREDQNEDIVNSFKIIDCLGNQIITGSFHGRKTQIETGEIKPGIYIVILTNESKVFKNKLIIN